MSNTPAITVLMSVYNAEADLKDSIESILNQTFTDFEFLIIDDGSTDSTPEILKTYAAQDKRIRIITQANTGLTKALNHGLSLASGKYIARQDADDVSYPERIRQQFDTMESHPEIILLGTNSDDVFENGFTTPWGHYTDDELECVVFQRTPFPHTSVMMRTEIARELGGYDERFRTSQDLEFWMRFATAGKISMLPEALVKRKVGNSSISAKRRWRQFYDALHAKWIHNTGLKNKGIALYQSLRTLVIMALPHNFIEKLKTRKH